MAETLKTLAQAYPAASTLTDAYTVPTGTAAVISSFTACNQSTSDTTFRLSVAVAGAADTPSQYLFYDLALPAKDTYRDVLGITLAAGDVVRVYSASGTVSFNLFGAQEN